MSDLGRDPDKANVQPRAVWVSGLLKGKLSKVQRESCREDNAQNGTSVYYERPKLRVIVVTFDFWLEKDGERGFSLLGSSI